MLCATASLCGAQSAFFNRILLQKKSQTVKQENIRKFSYGENIVVKANWGLKRHCPSCGGKYYDLGKNPSACPSCRYVYDITVPLRARRGRNKPAIVVDKDDPLVKLKADAKKAKAKAASEDFDETEVDSDEESEEIEEVDEIEVIEDLEEVDEDDDMDDDIVLEDDDVGDEILIDDVDDNKSDKKGSINDKLLKPDGKKVAARPSAKPKPSAKPEKKPAAKPAKQVKPAKPAKPAKKQAAKSKR